MLSSISSAQSSQGFDRDRLVQELRKNLQGDVWNTPSDLSRFSTDESIFSQLPSVVVAPKDEADVQAIIAVAQFFMAPITARGGGTSVAGQAIGSGIVVDFQPYFQKILDISSDSAVVQPGVTLQNLNSGLAKFRRRFAPDPGSRASCTLGGMVATNASGPHSFYYGSTRDHIQRLRVVLADGAIMESTSLLHRFPSLHRSLEARKSLIQDNQPKVRKNSSGYALEELCSKSPNYARFLVGSEGTLALTTEIEVQTIPQAPLTTLAVFPYLNLEQALSALEEIQDFSPVAIELVDSFLLRAIRKVNPSLARLVGLEKAKASLWVEWEGSAPKALRQDNCFLIEDKEGQSHLWTLRTRASKYLHEQSDHRKPLRCVEDGVVPMDKLSHYVEELQETLKKHDCEGAIFGHVGDGHLHVNPRIDVTAPRLPQRIEQLMNAVYGLILRLGGSISGEHGDGVLRRRFAEMQWAPLIPLFQQVKETFDPAEILNPGKKISCGPLPMPPFRNLLELGKKKTPTTTHAPRI